MKPASYAWYVSVLLGISYAVAFVDRQILNLLVDPIKHTLLLTDIQISLLQGSAFVVAYVVMGPVFGRLADQSSRRRLLIIGVLMWCVFTVLCGFSRSFWSLFGARAGIGAAEACLLPAGWSLLADYFSPQRLPRAMSIFLTGPFVGGGLALIFGGFLIQYFASIEHLGVFSGFEPWQLTFICVGCPGVLVALLLLTIREPARRVVDSKNDRRYGLAEVGQFLWRERTFYGRFFPGVALLIVGLYALPAWTPAFLMRLHHGTAGRVGLEYGAVTLVAGSLGLLLGPWISERLVRWYPSDAPLRTAMLGGLFAAPACLYLPFAPSYWSALIASAFASMSLNFVLPVAAAVLQSSTPNRMRGIVTSAYAFMLITTGLGLAPTIIATLTDRVLGGPLNVGLSLGWVSGLSAIASLPLLNSAARLAESVFKRNANL